MTQNEPKYRMFVIYLIVCVSFGTIMIAFGKTSGDGFRWSFFNGHRAEGFQVDRKVERSFVLNSTATTQIKTDIGDLFIEPSNSDTAFVVVELHGGKSELDRFELNFSSSPELLEISGRYPDHGMFHNSNNLDVRYRVKIPKSNSLELQTSGGDIIIADMNGSVHAETSGGDVQAGKIAGEVNLSTSGGDIRLHSSQNTVKLETSGGNISVQHLYKDAIVSTSGGDIRIDTTDAKLNAETSGGAIKIGVYSSTAGIEASTSGGDITLRTYPQLNANLYAKSQGGDVKCDFPITVQGSMEEGLLKGTINKGGPMIRLETSGGSIRIQSK